MGRSSLDSSTSFKGTPIKAKKKNRKNDKDSASYITRPEIGTYETEMGASGPEFDAGTAVTLPP